MKDYKKNYNNLKAPESLKRRVDETMTNYQMNNKKENKNTNKFKKYISIAAALAITFVGVTNLSPSLADSMSNIPGLEKFVDVITFGRFTYDDGNFEANIVTPQIEGLLDKDLENELNDKFKDYSNSLIYAFEQDIKKLKEESADNPGHFGVDSNYDLITDNENFISLDLYTVSTSASSYTVHSFYTIDKNTNNLIDLKDLFDKDSDFITPITNYIKDEMTKQMDKGEAVYWLGQDGYAEEFNTIKENQNFYINQDNQLVISFDKYEVAPGSQGNPEFTIPLVVIEDILANNNIK